MPFTFSHPAIVLPFKFLPRQWFSLTGLVIGSITPDFEYFLRMKVQSNYSHTIAGLFWFDLPLGIFLAFIFHNVVRDNLFDNLPTILNARLSVFKQFDWNGYFKSNWLVVLISVLIGAGSHLLWDGFTHEQAYFVQELLTLQSSIGLFGRQIPLFKVSQHASTLLGGLVVVYAFLQIPPNKIVTGKVDIKYWTIVTALTSAIIAVRILTGLDYKLYGHVIVTAISAGMISLVVTPMFIKLKV